METTDTLGSEAVGQQPGRVICPARLAVFQACAFDVVSGSGPANSMQNLKEAPVWCDGECPSGPSVRPRRLGGLTLPALFDKAVCGKTVAK